MPKESGKMNQREREICARVKQFREQIKWPQAAFAFELGTTKDQVASIEYQRTPLRYDIGWRVCLIFDVNPKWLATGNGPVAPNMEVSPTSGNLPKRILFSEVFDNFIDKEGAAIIVKTMSGAERELREEAKAVSVPMDDPTGFFVERLIGILRGEKFDKPILRQHFVSDVIHMANILALDYRRRRVKSQVRLGANFDPKAADLSQAPVAKVKTILALKKKIEDLQVQVRMLQDECGLPVDGDNPPPKKQPPV